MEQVDLSEADLSKAKFQNCDLSGAVFYNTNLEAADLQTSHNFSIDPENNKLQKAIFSTTNVSGLLDKYKIIVK